MIININCTNDIQSKLQLSNFRYYLSGSRYLGTEKPNSDWDYFVQAPASIELLVSLRNELEGMGFKADEDCGIYHDINTLEVWSTPNREYQVAIVQDATKREAIQRAIKNDLYFFESFPKSRRTELFNLIYQAMNNMGL